MHEDLLLETARLVDVPSVSRDEAAMADLVEEELRALPGLEVVRVGNNVVARTALGLAGRVVLAGHLDTVPPAGNERSRVEGDVCHGLGSADMKGGLAVLLALAWGIEAPRRDLTFVFYACEEIARSYSGLRELAAADPGLLAGDAAILLEPTNACIEAGCQGMVRFEVVLGGRRAHSARPWAGVNAVHRLAPVLEAVASFEERRPVIDGCEYRESLQAVDVRAGVAGNVVPDEARLVLSHRFAPDRDENQAAEAIGILLAPALDSSLGDRLEVLDSAPAAAPSLGHPVLAELVAASGQPPAAKIAWTDVAFFSELGVPAANFGPGDPLLAHHPDEQVTRQDLEEVRRALAGVLYG
ncbi:MAG TPA: succinyl-diaminopimelate desuccinylase [Acidimicrobiales bacterium]|nr:succinyl-diaminopimelate desuccinylase [Acidimicrobiales bacterium]